MKRGITIWGVLTLLAYVAALVKALATDSLDLRYAAYTLPLAAVLTIFVAILVEAVLVMLGVGKQTADR